MTAIILTVGVIVARFAALMAPGNDIVCDPLAQPFIENKVLSLKLQRKSLLLCSSGVFYDTSFYMKYILKAMMQ